jgi:hypothetical protein
MWFEKEIDFLQNIFWLKRLKMLLMIKYEVWKSMNNVGELKYIKNQNIFKYNDFKDIVLVYSKNNSMFWIEQLEKISKLWIENKDLFEIVKKQLY